MFFSKHRQPLSFRQYITVLGVISAVLLALGIGCFWWLSAQSPLLLLRGGSHTAPESAVFVPRQAPLMASLLTSPERLVEFRRVLTPPGRRSDIQVEMSQLKRSFLGQTGIDYDADIYPWIGDEITFAITDADFDHDPANGRQPGYLVAIAARDSDRAREFLELFWQRQALAGTKLTFKVSSGVRIIYADATPTILDLPDLELSENNSSDLTQAFDSLRQQGQLASAVVGSRFVLLANHPQVLQQSIRNAQAEQINLTARPDYQAALRHLSSKRIGVIYGNLPQFFSWLGVTSAPRSTFNVTTSSPQTESITAAIQLNRQGIRLATALSSKPSAAFMPPPEPFLSKPVKALQYLPSDAALAASGHDLSQLWNTLETELKFYTVLPPQLKQLRQLIPAHVAHTQAQLKGWLTGDYAVGQWTSHPGSPPEWILVAEHVSGADTAIAALDQLAEQQHLTVSSLSLKNHAITAWSQFQTSTQERFRERETIVETQILGLHTAVDGYDIFSTSLPAMTAALEAPLRSLADTSKFNQAIASFQQPNDGYLYVNWPQFRDTLAASVPWVKLLNITARPLLDVLQAVTVSSYGSQDYQKIGDVLIQLADPH